MRKKQKSPAAQREREFFFRSAPIRTLKRRKLIDCLVLLYGTSLLSMTSTSAFAGNITIPQLSGSAPVVVGTDALIVGSDNTDTSYSGTISMTGNGWDATYGTFSKIGSGTLTIDNATITGGESYIAGGALAQTSGNTSINYLSVGTGSQNTGALNISGGTLTFSTGLEVGAWGGTGMVTQTGGTVSVTAGCGDSAHCASFNIGNQGGSGSYNLTGGTLSLDDGIFDIGRNDNANPASHGTLNLSGTGQVIVSGGHLIVGDKETMTGGAVAGTGDIHQAGGTLSVDGTSNLYLSGSGDGSYQLDGGTLQIGGTSLHGSYNNLGGAYSFQLGGGSIQVIGSALDADLDATLLSVTTSVIDTNGLGADWSGVLSGSGALTKTGAGVLTLTGANSYSGMTTIASGTLALSGHGVISGSSGLIDNGNFDISAASSSIVLPNLSGSGNVNLGANTLAIGSDNSDSRFAGDMVGSGGLIKTGSGRLILDGNSNYAQGTEVQSGSLIIGSDDAHAAAAIAGNVIVDTNAVLGGHGSVGGDVGVLSGGHLAPGNSSGTLSIGGQLDLAQNSQLDFEFAPATSAAASSSPGESIAVAGDINANGAVLNISAPGGMGPGLYTLLSYGGELHESGNGLTLGNTPGGGYSIQLLTDDKRVDLLDTNGLALNFWNGNGQASSSQRGGGDGTWSVTSSNWTDADALTAGPMQPQPGFAILGGHAGHVAVDDGAGAVTVTGLQFASDGYHLDGDKLTLVSDAQNGNTIPVIRVGDGTAAGAAYIATIDSVLAGSSGLEKTDLGTLVLTGNNSYVGPTVLGGGTVSVSADANLGDAGNPLDFEGGTLQITGDTCRSTTRSIMWGSAGGGFDIVDADNTFSVAQDLVGSGSLHKSGDGTLILGGNNTYGGGTTVDAGILQGDSRSLQGGIVDNATVVFDQAVDGVYSGSLSGAGTLNKRGIGTLVVNGSNAFSGDTQVSEGTLIVGDDDHAHASLSGMVAVSSVATLGGIGRIGGLDLSGTLAPGNSIGTLSVDGNATFRTGSNYRIEVAPDGRNDRIAVGGTATILGGSALAIGSGEGWAARTEYTILTAAGGISGAFAAVDSNLAFLTPSLSYTANAVNMTLERNDISLASVAQTDNQRGVAGVIDGFDFGNHLYDAVVALDATAARQAFDQLSGEPYASTRTALIDDSRYVRDAIERHLLGLDNNSNGTQGSTGSGVTAWSSAWGHWGDHDSAGGAAGMSANGSGLLVGADLPLANGRLGVVAGHGQDSMQIADRNSSAHTTATQLGIYGAAAFGQVDLQGGLAYAWQHVTSTRQVAFGGYRDQLTGDYHAPVAQAFVEAGYRFEIAASQQLEPFAKMARVQLHTDAVNEAGGAAALNVAGSSSAVNTATLGLRDTLTLSTNGDIRAHGSIGWQQAWGDLVPAAGMRFASDSHAFDVTGVPVARHALAVDAGLSFRIARHAQVDASYVGQFASEARDQGARMSLKIDF